MALAIDDAMKAIAAAEATYNADIDNVSTIETAIATATQPLAPAQSKLTTDGGLYVTALQAGVAALQAEIAAVQPPPAV